jgi:hypothetical protein
VLTAKPGVVESKPTRPPLAWSSSRTFPLGWKLGVAYVNTRRVVRTEVDLYGDELAWYDLGKVRLTFRWGDLC